MKWFGIQEDVEMRDLVITYKLFIRFIHKIFVGRWDCKDCGKLVRDDVKFYDFEPLCPGCFKNRIIDLIAGKREQRPSLF